MNYFSYCQRGYKYLDIQFQKKRQFLCQREIDNNFKTRLVVVPAPHRCNVEVHQLPTYGKVDIKKAQIGAHV